MKNLPCLQINIPPPITHSLLHCFSTSSTFLIHISLTLTPSLPTSLLLYLASIPSLSPITRHIYVGKPNNFIFYLPSVTHSPPRHPVLPHQPLKSLARSYFLSSPPPCAYLPTHLCCLSIISLFLPAIMTSTSCLFFLVSYLMASRGVVLPCTTANQRAWVRIPE